MQQSIIVTVNFNPTKEQEFENIVFNFEKSKTDFLKWVWTMCMNTPWEAAYILADEFIADDTQLQVFMKNYFSGSPDPDEIYNDLYRFANELAV
jgi:hypothetical protein